MEFKRGLDTRGALGLGGYQFETLKKGAILNSKKYFGLSHGGNLRGYTNSAIQISRKNTFLITHIENEGKKKTLWGMRFHNLETAEKFKEEYLGEMNGNSIGLSQAKKIGYKSIIYISDMTKRKFDYRFEVAVA